MNWEESDLAALAVPRDESDATCPLEEAGANLTFFGALGVVEEAGEAKTDERECSGVAATALFKPIVRTSFWLPGLTSGDSGKGWKGWRAREGGGR